MGTRRRRHHGDTVVVPTERGVSVVECAEPGAEAAALRGPGVQIVRSARDGRDLLARVGTTGRQPSRQGLDTGPIGRRGALPDAPTAPPMTVLHAVPDPAPAPVRGTDDPDAHHDTAPAEPRDGARGRFRPEAADRAAVVAASHLRALAEMERHWGLRGFREALDHHAERSRRVRLTAAAAAIAAVGFLALVAVAPLLVVGAPVAAAVGVERAVSLRRSDRIADETRRAQRDLELEILRHHGLTAPPAGAASSWYPRLAQLGLPEVPPSTVDAVVADFLRASASALPADLVLEPPARPVRPAPDVSTGSQADDDEAVIDLRAPVLDGVHLVVVVDDDLYSGQRIALRQLSQALARHVPLLVLTTNRRVWDSVVGITPRAVRAR